MAGHTFQSVPPGGWGILIGLSSPIVRNNLIVNHQAVNKQGMVSAGGGGIRAGHGNPLIENNTIINNASAKQGGGILVWSTSVTARNNVIRAYTETGDNFCQVKSPCKNYHRSRYSGFDPRDYSSSGISCSIGLSAMSRRMPCSSVFSTERLEQEWGGG